MFVHVVSGFCYFLLTKQCLLLPVCLNGVDVYRPLEDFREIPEFSEEKLKNIFLRLWVSVGRERGLPIKKNRKREAAATNEHK